MDLKKHKVLISSVLAFCALVVSGYVIYQSLIPKVPVKSSLLIGVSILPARLDPLRVEFFTRRITINIFEGLVSLDSSFRIRPALSSGWAQDQEDDRIWRFHMRSGVTFHDGAELNAALVADSLGKLLKDRPKEMSQFMDTIDRVSVDPDTADTVVLHLKQRDTLILRKMSFIPILHTAKAGQMPVGTGPYVVEDKTTDSRMVHLVRNQNYWGRSPYFRDLVFTWIPDKVERLERIQDGSLDILLDAPPVVENKATHIKTVDVPGLELLYMVYNQKKLGPESPLNDPKTRAHISAFLDRGRFADIAEGLAAPALQFSVSAIASLSNLAGAPQVMDSVLMQEYMKDKAMTIHLTVPQTLKKIAEELREQLKKVYVIVDIAVIDSEDTFEKGITDGSYETYLVGWKFELGDLEPFFTDQVHSMKGYMGHYNGGAYTNPLVDTKIEELMNVSDGKVRRQIAQDIQNVITWDDPLGIPLIETRRRIMYQQSLYFEPRLDGLVLFFEVQSL